MGPKELQDIIDAPVPLPDEITEETRALTKSEAERHRGSVRVHLGKFYTTQEYEARKRRVLDAPLPG
jgi:hypothetical protein